MISQAGELLDRDHPVLERLHALAGRLEQTVWLCGGTLRDISLGRRPPDLDLAASGDALALGRALAGDLGGRPVTLGHGQVTCRVVWGGRHLDLAGLRAPDILGDLWARDFTVNALAWPLGDFLEGRESLLDPTGGLADLRAGVLRPAGPGVLEDDPLRVLRGFRFMSTHSLTPAPGVMEDLAEAGLGLLGVAAERIGKEWLALMDGPGAGAAVLAMEEAGVLTRLVPELDQGRGMAQNPYHHLDVFQHCLATLAEAGRISADPGAWLGELGEEVREYLPVGRRRPLLMTAALLHDLGKPVTREEKEPEWATFYKHEIRGASLAEERCRALGFSGSDSRAVGHLVTAHMRPFHLLGAESRGHLSKKAIRRLLMMMGEDLPALLVLAMADTLAGRGPERPPEAEERLLALWRRVVDLRDRELAQALASPPLVKGRELMQALGLPPGPEVGRLLAMLREAQLDGKVRTPAEALALARSGAEGGPDEMDGASGSG